MSSVRSKTVSLLVCLLLAANAAFASYVLAAGNTFKTPLVLIGLIICAVLLELTGREIPYLGNVSIALPLYAFAMMYPPAGGWPGAVIIATVGVCARTFIVNGQPMWYKIADLSSSLLALTVTFMTFFLFLTLPSTDPMNYDKPISDVFSTLSETGKLDLRFSIGFICSAVAFLFMDIIYTTSSAAFIGAEILKQWNKIRNKIRFFYFASFAIAFLSYLCMASGMAGLAWTAVLLAAFYFSISFILAEDDNIDAETISKELAIAESERDKLEKSCNQISGDLKKKIDELSVIHEMSKALGSSTNLDSSANIIMSMVRKFVRYQSCIIFLLRKGELRPFKSDSPYRAQIPSGEIFGDIKETFVNSVVRTRSSVLVGGEYEPQGRLLIDSEISAICIPFLIKERILGVLYIGDTKANSYNERHLNILSTLTLSAAISLESAQLYEEKESSLERTRKTNEFLIKSLDQMRILNEFAMHLGSSLKADDVLDYACEKLGDLIEYQSMIIFAAPEDEEKPSALHAKRTKGPYAETLAELTYKADEGLIGWIMKNKKPIWLGGSRKSSDYPSLIENEPSSIIVPMVIENKIIGIVYIGSENDDFYNENSLNLVSTVAYQTAMALKNAELYEKMVALAITDGLTGLYTHRYFKERLAESCKEYERTKKTFSLIMVDTDHFKSYNDTLGHPEGDKLLKEIASLLKTYCRDTDLVARYGGDEFAVILKESDKENSIRVAERIREAFVSKFGSYKVRITASIGVANFPMDASKMSDFLVAADNALYNSKKNGRNRVTAAAPSNDSVVVSSPTQRKPTRQDVMNKTKELSPAQLLEIRQNYMQKLQSQPNILKDDKDTNRISDTGRFHIPDSVSPDRRTSFMRSTETQIFNPDQFTNPGGK